MNIRGDQIYILIDTDDQVFYVGRSIHPRDRFYEHRSSAQHGTEAKYSYIRDLWKNGKDFTFEVVDDNPGKHYERYYHYVYGLVFDLTNMRLGDLRPNKRLMRITGEMKAESKQYSGPKEFLDDYERRVLEEKAQRQRAKTQEKIRKPVAEFVEPLYSFEKPQDHFMSPAMKEIKERKK